MTTGAGQRRSALPGRLATTLALSASLLLAGCSGDSADKADKAGPDSSSTSTPSSSATASPSPSSTVRTATTEKPPTPPRATRGKKGQQAFARHVMAAWSYGLRTNDAKPLTGLSPAKKACAGCKVYVAELAKRRKEHWTVDFAGLKVRSVKLTQQGPGQTYAKAKVDIPASDSYTTDGTFRNTSTAHPGATFEVVMGYAKKRYRLLAFTVS
jgi:hypothetical protein